MPDLKRFRDKVTLYRKRRDNVAGRPYTQAELAKEIGLSADELGHRLRGNGRLPLNQENILAIVETLAAWETLSLQEAEDLLTWMDYPLQKIDWQATPWCKLHTDLSLSKSASSSSQSNKAPSGRAAQAREQERTLYLQHMIQTNEQLILPGGREIPLERLYVCLRADEMQTKERQAEHALYLQEVAMLAQDAGTRLPDPYHSFVALRNVIARHPKMFMLDARNWPRLFGERESQSHTLDEVLRRHQQVVILGDPGSGKTTLGKWLMVQFARSLLHNDAQVRVPAGLAFPVAQSEEEEIEEERELDLGIARLPVFVSIAQYARIRKPKEQPDRRLSLYEYLQSGLFLDSLRLPRGLSQETAGAIVDEAIQKGQALVVLDGLDEVSDPIWRGKIMEAVRRFLQEWCLLKPTRNRHFIESDRNDHSENQIVITSRIVGYQFDPLVDLSHYTIEAMDEWAIRAFCHTWMRHVAQPLASAEEVSRWGEQLHNAIFEEAHPGARSMAGNPLLLTLMIQLVWKRSQTDGLLTLPARRVSLFEEVERTFYQQREDLWKQAGITSLRLTRALGAVAVALHASETAGFATEEDVRKHLGNVLAGEEQVEAMLTAAREVSGFLIARGEGVYGFLHRAVQEYFAAQHLVRQPEQAVDTIMAHVLHPLWREPVVLAFGLISRPRYSEKVLSALFTAMLNLPDPASSVLPRRELLAMAACAECERIPDGIGRHLARHLLLTYTSQSKLQQQIQQAFMLCQRMPAKTQMEVETVLCAAVKAEAFSQRRAVVDLIIKTEWDTPAIAEALIVAWRTYAAPAGSLLVALEKLQERQPAWFDARLLPLKRQMAAKPHLWEYTKTHPKWQRLLKMLYLPQSSPFVLEQVNRDSPLTEEIIIQLEQGIADPAQLLTFCQRLHLLAGQPGSALARDAALALSAIGKLDWISSWGEHIREQERLARPVLAALNYFSRHALSHTRALDLDRTLAQNPDLDLDLDRVLILTPLSDLDHTTTDNNLFQALNRALGRQGMQILCINPTCFLDGDYPLERAHADFRSLDRIRAYLDKIEQKLQSAKQRWVDHVGPVQTIDEALTTVQEMGGALFIENVLASLVNTYSRARREDGSQSRSAPPQITPETFPGLIKDLVSPDDEHRHLARKILTTSSLASTLGKALIESVVLKCQQASRDGKKKDKRQVQTQLRWILSNITHDRADWILAWIHEAKQAEEENPSVEILSTISKVTPEVFENLLQVLPRTAPPVKQILLGLMLNWLKRAFYLAPNGKEVSQMQFSSFAKQLPDWLDEVTIHTLFFPLLEVLAIWEGEEGLLRSGLFLLECLETGQCGQEESALALALAHLARRQPALREPVHAILLQKKSTCSAALACLWTAMIKHPLSADELLSLAQKEITDSASCFNAFLGAGVDDYGWTKEYHGLLVSAAHRLLECISDNSVLVTILQSLLERLHQALEVQDWLTRRMTLAVVAAYAETMPMVLRQADEGNLEQLLVRGTIDEGSYTSRRFALTALSYLRTVTADVVPALIAGCQDIEEMVQKDTIEAARRFQRIEGDLLSNLLPLLTGESVSTAYAVGQLLGALGTSHAGTAAGLQERIMTGLVEALKDPGSKRTVTIAGQDEGTLENALYDALLRVAGWIG